MSQLPPPIPPPAQAAPVSPMSAPATTPGLMIRPHRGTTVQVLGILSLVFTFGGCLLSMIGVPFGHLIGLILGIIGWVMGAGDLKMMSAGLMDPLGRQQTSSGKVCSMISVIFGIVMLVLTLLLIFGVLALIGVAGWNAGSPSGTP